MNPAVLADPYLSRTSDSWSVLARREPVVYGAAPDGPLHAGQLSEFDRRGFLILPGLISPPEIEALRRAALSIWEHENGTDREAPSGVIREPGVRTVRSIFAVHRDVPAFGRLAAHPFLVRAARQLLGSEVYIHQSRVNYKPGFVGREFYWHSDFETWHMEDGMPGMRCVSCVVLLSENTEHNGPLLLIPGSHKQYVTTVGETPREHYRQSLKAQEIGVPDQAALRQLVKAGGIVSATGPAGSILLFDCNTMHGSGGNITPFSRDNLFFVCNSVENSLVAPFAGTPARPEFIAHREFTPVAQPAIS